MSYAKEVEMIALAREMDLLTTPYVFDEEDAVAMAGPARTSSWRTWG